MVKRGFTLIELSIVLVIIGLIVGGVVAGRELIHQAQLRKVITSYETFETALSAFRVKFNCLPGDCANASQFFPGATNGNGNGTLDVMEYFFDGTNYYCMSGTYNNLTGASCGNTSTNGPNEGVLQWEHLGQSGLVNTLPFLSASTPFQMGVHANSILGTHMNLFAYWRPGGHFIATGGTAYGYVLFMGPSGYGSNGTLYPYDAHSIDRKVDDGLPKTGMLQGVWRVYASHKEGPESNGCSVDPDVNLYDPDPNYESIPFTGHIGCTLQKKAPF